MTSRPLRMSAIVVFILLASSPLPAEDWPMFGRDGTRNAVSPETGPPTEWAVSFPDGREADRNVRWKADLGNTSCGSPIVSGGLVWVCTNNERPRDPAQAKDASSLMCFDARTGAFLWQHLSPRLGGRVHDWTFSSMASPPLIEGGRLWTLTSRWEVLCLDITPLLDRTGVPRELWKLDLRRELGVFGRSPSMALNMRCAIASYRGFVYVITGNGVDENWRDVPAPQAPALVCLEKETGKLVWSDNSPGGNILSVQIASPLVAEVNGRAQVVAPLGDGWIRSFDALTGRRIWEFDANPKGSVYPQTRNELLAAPVLYEGRIYFGTGQGAEHGEGPGLLWCIDPAKEGDVSEELDDGPAASPPGERRAVGGPRKSKPNPNSAVVWKFDRIPPAAGAKPRMEDRMNRTCSSVAIADGLVIAADFSGFVHCLDARTGRRLWVHDAEDTIYGSPLICDGKVYVGAQGSTLDILALSREKRLLARRDFGQFIYCSPVYANGLLYVATRTTLYAIGQEPPTTKPARTSTDWPQWRGPDRTNLARDEGLLSEWPEGGPPLRWRTRGLGQGATAVSSARGRVYTLGYRQDAEFLTAWDAGGGAKLWEAAVGPAVKEFSGMRWLSPRAPTVDTGRVYVVTARGELICLSTADGVELWRKDYVKDFGGKAGSWGYCDFPLVDGDRLICTPGGARASVVALDKATGDLIWACPVPGCDRSTYSTLVIAESTRRHYVQQFDCGAVGIDEQGELLWQYDGLRLPRLWGNVHAPLVKGDLVFLSGGWGVGAALLSLKWGDRQCEVVEHYKTGPSAAFDAWIGNSVWTGERVYTTGGSCLDVKTGAVIRRPSALGRGTLVAAEGHLYYRGRDGTMALVKVDPERYVEKSRFLPPRATQEPAWTSPVIAGGLLYLRDQDELLCYDLRKDRSTPVGPPQEPVVPGEARAGANAAVRRVPKDEHRRGVADAIFVPTPQDVVDRMLELASVKEGDVVYDLGCGDGRIVVTAARKYRCQAVGYDVDPECVRLSRELAQKEGVAGRVTVEQKDLFAADLRGASVVTLYLGRDMNRRLLPQLMKLRDGARIVSHAFDLEGYEPDRVVEVVSDETDTAHRLYLWTTPLKKRG